MFTKCTQMTELITGSTMYNYAQAKRTNLE